MSKLKNIHGFSLVEVLVALVVLSIGMLSVATLYVRGLQFSQTALVRSGAVQLAADMADRIRANSTATVAYAGGGANNNCIEGGIDCTPVQLAANDIFVCWIRIPVAGRAMHGRFLLLCWSIAWISSNRGVFPRREASR